MEYEEGDPLCCCEYVNAAGEKNHVLAMFCDCQDLDEGCDRFLKGEGIGRQRLRVILNVILDRIRVPTFFGSGAKRIDSLVDITALPPVFVVPLWLYIASFHPILTLVSFLVVPTSVLLYYLLVLRHRRRTQFFMSWGLVSTVYIYWVFVQRVLDLGHVGAAQTAAISMVFVAMLGAFFLSKHNPGKVTDVSKRRDSLTDWFRISTNSTDDMARVRSYSDPLQRRLNANDVSPVVNGLTSKTASHSSSSNSSNDSDPHSPVKSINKQSPDRPSDLNWCQTCQLTRPQRAGHCRICQHCVKKLDHHCVWIDSCVGEKNHRSFLAAALMFVVGSLWGSVLSFNSIFPLWTSEIPDVWHVYTDPRLALIFVSLCYALLAAAFMSSLIMVQFHNITHNWTSRELKLVQRNPEYREIMIEQDEGFCQNWFNFLIMQKSEWRERISSQNV